MSSNAILSYAGWAFLPNVCALPLNNLALTIPTCKCLKVVPTNMKICSSLQAGSNPSTMASPSEPVTLNPSQGPQDMRNTDGAYT